MLRKVIAVGVGALTAVLAMGSVVQAATGTISGTSYSQCVCFSCTGAVVSCSKSFCVKRCSIDAEGILKGLGNVSKGPNATAALYDVILFIQDAFVSCVNKAGNTATASGQPFIGTDTADLEKADTITNAKIDKNGTAVSKIVFTDEEILAALFAAGAFAGTGITSPADLCPNANWQPRVLVEKLQALGRVFFDDDPATSCNLVPSQQEPLNLDECTLGDAQAVQCFAPTGATASTPFTYVGGSPDGSPPCDTLCHDKTGSICPDPNDEPSPYPLPFP
jgi:hypothetical protein